MKAGALVAHACMHLLTIKPCEHYVHEYEEALTCYSTIDPNLPLPERVAAVEECNQGVGDAWQKLVDKGCVCDYLSGELNKALDCFANAGTDPIAIAECQENVNKVIDLLNQHGCLS